MSITASYELDKREIKEFEGLVTKIFHSVLEIGQSLVREALERMDEAVMESRDRERYRCKGFQKTCIKIKLVGSPAIPGEVRMVTLRLSPANL